MKDINDLINKIKTQDELMSLDEVGAGLVEPTPPFYKVFWKQIGIAAIALLSVVSAIFWISPGGSKKTFTANTKEKIENTIDSVQLNTVQNDIATTNEPKEKDLTKSSDQPTRIKTPTTSTKQREQNTQKQALPTKIIEDGSGIAINTEPNSGDNNVPPVKISPAPLTDPAKTKESNAVTSLSTPKPTTKNNSTAFPTSEAFYYDSWQKESQSFSLSMDKANVIQGKEGTIVIIPKNALCGTYESFNAEIQLTEYYSREDMLNGQLTTASHGDMLESAGMIDLTASVNGKALRLCKDVTVLFPSDKYQDTGFVGFSGSWDEGHNTINWDTIGGVNRNFWGGIAIPNCHKPNYLAIRTNWTTRKAELKTKGKSNLRKDYRNDEVIRRIRRRFLFQDSTTSKLYDEVYEGIKYRMSDTLSASAYRACRESRAKALALQNFLDSIKGGGALPFDASILNQQTGYILANVSELGPINCDRFTKYEATKNYTYKIGDSEGEVSSRMIFRDIQSILPGKSTKTGAVKFTKIPSGQRATLLVIKYLDDEIHIAYDEITIGKEPSLNFQPVAKSEVVKVIEAAANGKKYSVDAPTAEVQESKDHYWKSKADSLKAIYLTDNQLEKIGIYKYDDVLLFSKTSEDDRHEISFTKDGKNSFARSGNVRQFKNEVPFAIVSKKNVFYGSQNLGELRNNSSKYIPILVPFESKLSKYTLWYFEKNKQMTEQIPKKINVSNYNANNISHYEKEDDPNDEKSAIPKIASTEVYDQSQAIIPTSQLLEKLNIKVDDEGIFYQSKGQIGDNNSISLKGYYTESSYGNLKVLPKTNDYAPSFFTQKRIPSFPISVTEFKSTNDRILNSDQYFYAHKQDMIALPLLKPDSSEVVFWYEDTASILSLLKVNEANRIRTHLEMSGNLDLNIVSNKNTDDKALIDKMQEFKNLKELSIRPIVLTPELLQKLDIEVIGKDISYTIYPSKEMQLKITFLKDHSLSAFIPMKNDGPSGKIMPQIISDKYGKSYRLTITEAEKKADIDRLIPVYVSSTESYHLSDYFDGSFHPDCIFWYEPTEEFLALLPKDIREQLKYELTLIPNDAQASSQLTTENKNNNSQEPKKQCVYLDPCSDIKTNLKELKLYPNPTTGDVNIKISATEATSGTLSINNLAGQELKSVQLADIRQGVKIDISDLPAGIYLVTLLTNDGDKITRRVIRE